MIVAYFILSQCIFFSQRTLYWSPSKKQTTPSKCFSEESLRKGLFTEVWSEFMYALGTRDSGKLSTTPHLTGKMEEVEL